VLAQVVQLGAIAEEERDQPVRRNLAGHVEPPGRRKTAPAAASNGIQDRTRAEHGDRDRGNALAPGQPNHGPGNRVPGQPEQRGLRERHRIGTRKQQPGQRPDQQPEGHKTPT
jgi:hypothetical protein